MIAIGTMKLAGEFDGLKLYKKGRKSFLDVINKSIDMGINNIDTAPLYALGLAELYIGEILKNNEVNVWTKVGVDIESKPLPFRDYSYRGLKLSLKGSLNRLGTDKVDKVFIHNPQAKDLANKDIGFFCDWVLENELANYIGVSIYRLSNIDAILKNKLITDVMIELSEVDKYPNELLKSKRIIVRSVFDGGFTLKEKKEKLRKEYISKMIGEISELKFHRIIISPRTVQQLEDYIDLPAYN
ncbi:TPA: aldo/keto reductase [Vibrio parahaemolyticus]|uniref:aldo/keto reductase n=1 Tax=Vibrio parahaemolyticus TaxID=670 RepID=UPI0022B480FA|nr:aldo/keto reductase [Vibrio parahaemolyticus]ELB1989224.1 aldo/keto reductase [Vibrio parahaemolyticus]MCZ6311099.1 aldo/keto reductase [Vibrio parahaemolyticus]HBN6178898.1 aldo/keto reductase [Vibrio parahaemolyticus]HBN6318075.1 aldo/keto reductase [Vibrio parahaemolyticus]HCD5130802.1 aldo/keto reductase [Vibrio parahaemolyticus]